MIYTWRRESERERKRRRRDQGQKQKSFPHTTAHHGEHHNHNTTFADEREGESLLTCIRDSPREISPSQVSV